MRYVEDSLVKIGDPDVQDVTLPFTIKTTAPPPPEWWLLALAAGVGCVVIVGGVIAYEEAKKVTR